MHFWVSGKLILLILLLSKEKIIGPLTVALEIYCLLAKGFILPLFPSGALVSLLF